MSISSMKFHEGKGKDFYDQGRPRGKSTPTFCVVNYQLVKYPNRRGLVEVDHKQLRKMATIYFIYIYIQYIYIKDLDTNIVSKLSKLSKFSDDTKLCHRARDCDDISKQQDDIKKLVEWATSCE